MAAITTSRSEPTPGRVPTEEPADRSASMSVLRGLFLAVPVGVAMWVLLFSLGRLAVS